MLTREQMMTALPPTTREVSVPEMGEGATVLIGTIGPHTYGRLMDLFEEVAKPKTKPQRATTDEEDGAIYTCDTPPEERPDAEQEPESEGERTLTLSIGDDMRLSVEWAAAVIVDPETLEPMFSTDDVERVFRGCEGRRALTRIVQAGQELNLQTKDSREELEKNSETTANDASGGD